MERKYVIMPRMYAQNVKLGVNGVSFFSERSLTHNSVEHSVTLGL